MTRGEQNFRDRLADMLDGYYPNDEGLDMISNVLYRIALEVIVSEDIESEMNNTVDLNDLVKGSFRKHLRDVALFICQNVMNSALKNAMAMVRNVTDLIKVDRVKYTGEREYSVGIISKPSDTKSYKTGDDNTGNFEELDIDSIPKTSEETKDKIRAIFREARAQREEEALRYKMSNLRAGYSSISNNSSKVSGIQQVDIGTSKDDIFDIEVGNEQSKDSGALEEIPEATKPIGLGGSDDVCKKMPNFDFDDLDY